MQRTTPPAAPTQQNTVQPPYGAQQAAPQQAAYNPASYPNYWQQPMAQPTPIGQQPVAQAPPGTYPGYAPPAAYPGLLN
jgi:hypothetical protein